MVKIKRLADTSDLICQVESNIAPTELTQRNIDYKTLSDKRMKTKYLHFVFRPVHLHWDERKYEEKLYRDYFATDASYLHFVNNLQLVINDGAAPKQLQIKGKNHRIRENRIQRNHL